MADQPERRFFGFRQDPAAARAVAGTALVYGETCRLPWGEERIERGAFGDVGTADIVLNFQHRRDSPLARTGRTAGAGSLVLTDGEDALRARAELADTALGRDTWTLIRDGILRGFSIEFYPITERYESDLRIVESARLSGLAIVDKPAYPAAEISARQAAIARNRKPMVFVL